MAYDATKPLDDGYLAEAPAELRELHRALKEDKIVNAGMLNGYTQGNGNGKIPLNNGTLNTNLNADMLDGHDSAYFSASTHEHDGATTSAAGFMTATQVTKLNGIATGAEVNQNAFSNVTVGSSTIQADGKTDTLTLAAGNAITLTADTTNDKVTIAVTSNTFLPLAGGTMTGALTFANGVWNLVGDDVKIGDFNKAGLLGVMGANGTTGIAFCKRDDAATYKAITFDGTNLSLGGYTLLKSVPADAQFTDTVYTHPTSEGNKHIPAGGSSGQILRWSAAGTAAWGADNNTDTKVTATKTTMPQNETKYYLLASSSEATATEGAVKFGTNARIKGRNGYSTESVDAEGYIEIVLGNSIAVGANNNITGQLSLYNDKGKYHTITPHPGDTSSRDDIYTPKSNGTLVCHTTDTAIGSATKPVYVNANGVATACSLELTVPVCSCATAAGTAAKVASVTSGTFALKTGAIALVVMTNNNTSTSNLSLNIGSTGVKNVYGANMTGCCLVLYDGSVYRVVATGMTGRAHA